MTFRTPHSANFEGCIDCDIPEPLRLASYFRRVTIWRTGFGTRREELLRTAEEIKECTSTTLYRTYRCQVTLRRGPRCSVCIWDLVVFSSPCSSPRVVETLASTCCSAVGGIAITRVVVGVPLLQALQSHSEIRLLTLSRTAEALGRYFTLPSATDPGPPAPHLFPRVHKLLCTASRT